MSENFISLKCPSCGGKLDVYGDMNNFACGYCGTEIVTKRRGGTVALEAITNAIGKVQIGTDKTAAELAIVRNEKDLANLNEQLKKQARTSSGLGLMILGGFFLFATFGVIGSHAPMLEIIMFLIFSIGPLLGGYKVKYDKAKKMAELNSAIAEVKSQLDKNMAIVNR